MPSAVAKLRYGTRSVPATFTKTNSAQNDLDPEGSSQIACILLSKNLGIVRDFARKTWPRCGSGYSPH